MPVAPPDVVAALRAAGCVYAEDEATLLIEEATDREQLLDWVRRRVGGEPLEYIVGWAEFAGMRVAVDPGVFVPRRRTEAIVDAVAPLLRPGEAMLDLCCGSGALAAALATRVPGVTVLASDIDPVAVRCARRNLPDASVFVGDLFDATPPEWAGHLEVITANTPYVPTAALQTMPVEARDHEPPATLDGGRDGLDVQRRVAAQAGAWLTATGSLAVEVAAAQADAAAAIMTGVGLAARIVVDTDRDAVVVLGKRR